MVLRLLVTVEVARSTEAIHTGNDRSSTGVSSPHAHPANIDFPRRRLEAFVDGELSESDTERVCFHLVDCPECSSAVRHQIAIHAALQRLGRAQESTAPPS